LEVIGLIMFAPPLHSTIYHLLSALMYLVYFGDQSGVRWWVVSHFFGLPRIVLAEIDSSAGGVAGLDLAGDASGEPGGG